MGYLRVRNLGKAYKRYPHKWGRLAEWVGLGVRHELKGESEHDWRPDGLTFRLRFKRI